MKQAFDRSHQASTSASASALPPEVQYDRLLKMICDYYLKRGYLIIDKNRNGEVVGHRLGIIPRYLIEGQWYDLSRQINTTGYESPDSTFKRKTILAGYMGRVTHKRSSDELIFKVSTIKPDKITDGRDCESNVVSDIRTVLNDVNQKLGLLPESTGSKKDLCPLLENNLRKLDDSSTDTVYFVYNDDEFKKIKSMK